MKKFAKHLWSLTFPAVILFLVIFGNMSSAAQADAGPADGGPIMCPPKRPADGGICDPRKLSEETPPIPMADGGTTTKQKVKIHFKERELVFEPTAGKAIPAPAQAPEVDAGVSKELVNSRRAEVLFASSSIKESMSEKLKTEVRIHNFLFAQNYTANADAAITIFETGEGKNRKETAVMFLYSKGAWSVLPTDLIEFTP